MVNYKGIYNNQQKGIQWLLRATATTTTNRQSQLLEMITTCPQLKPQLLCRSEAQIFPPAALAMSNTCAVSVLSSSGTLHSTRARPVKRMETLEPNLGEAWNDGGCPSGPQVSKLPFVHHHPSPPIKIHHLSHLDAAVAEAGKTQFSLIQQLRN